MSDNALAQAAARISALEQTVSQITHDRDQVRAAQKSAEAAAAQLQPVRDELSRAKDRVTELETLLAEPPAQSGVEIVRYYAADGTTLLKQRYRVSDGAKFKLLPDAMRQQAILAIMTAAGISETAAAQLIEQRIAVIEHLRAL